MAEQIQIPYPVPFQLQELVLSALSDEQFEDLGAAGRRNVIQLMSLAYAQGAAEGRSAGRLDIQLEQIHEQRIAERAAAAMPPEAEGDPDRVAPSDEKE